jgi:hypothetical protein
VNQHRRHVNKLARHVDVELSYALDINQVLRRDLRDGDIIDVDVLLADQVQQQVERPFVNLTELDSERKIAAIVFALL